LVFRPRGVDVRCRCAAAGFPTGPYAISGGWCQVDESRPPIISVWMELTGPRAGDYELFYQAGFARDGTAPLALVMRRIWSGSRKAPCMK